MRYTNTAIKELKKRYKNILIKCAIINAAALLSFAMPASAVELSPNEPIDIRDGGSYSINEDINISASGDGILVLSPGTQPNPYDGTQLTIKANNVSISTDANGAYGTLWTQTRSSAEQLPEDATQIDITANNISLIAPNANAIVAFSNSEINLNGNTVINAKNAILARGYSSVNINTTDTTKTLKMDGNIGFNYYSKNSNSPIDTDINISLNGSDSYWTGNVYRSWDIIPDDESLLTVSRATIKLNDGATWNVTQITPENSLEQISLNNLIVKKGTINVQEGATARIDNLTVNDLTLNGKITVDTVTFEAGSKLTTALDDTVKIEAKKVSIGDGSMLNLIIDGSVEEKSYNFINAKEDITGAFTIDDNGLYSFTQDETGTITATKKSAEDIASDTGASAQDTTALLAIIAADGTGTEKGSQFANLISEQMQSGNTSAAINAVKTLAPTTSQLVSGVAKETASTISRVSTSRLDSIKGTSGGDLTKGAGLWMQGLYNHTKQNSTSSSEGFKANSRGFALGIDTNVTDSVTLGLGYGYMNTDADTFGKDIDVDGHNFFLYGKYQPSQWYVTSILNYNYSRYTEKKSPLGIALQNKYNVNSYSAHLMSGYDLKNGLTPEIGLRYLVVDADSYFDGIQRIRSNRDDVLTAVAGLKYETKAYSSNKLTLKPSARVALTYDLISDNSNANVLVLGGSNYSIEGNRLHRLGAEATLGATATMGNLDLTLEYNGAFRQDYRSQGGMIKARYNF